MIASPRPYLLQVSESGGLTEAAALSSSLTADSVLGTISSNLGIAPSQIAVAVKGRFRESPHSAHCTRKHNTVRAAAAVFLTFPSSKRVEF